MHAFRYLKNQLHCENVSVSALAKEHGTPLYVYSGQTIQDHYRRLDAALAPLDHLICFAVKANSNLAVLNLLASEGSGFDIVSGGELFRVLKAGGSAGKCTFAGVAKSEEEIEFALKKGIYSFNVESEAELKRIDSVAHSLGKEAPVALRVNPDVEADTHKYISTGKSENKFGVSIDRIEQVYKAASRLKNVRLRGVQIHIGSQITKSKPFSDAVTKMVSVVENLKGRYGLEFFSIGGGVGIVYQDSLKSGEASWWDAKSVPLTIDAYAKAVIPLLQPLGLRILLEPGRFLVGNAGILVTKVEYIKQTPAKRFVIVDAGMNDLIRPALYESYHEIVPVKRGTSASAKVDVVGPVCESGDFFAQDRELPGVKEGELLALMSTGAYGFVMASNYNSRPNPAEILVHEGVGKVVRKRQTLQDLIRGESTRV